MKKSTNKIRRTFLLTIIPTSLPLVLSTNPSTHCNALKRPETPPFLPLDSTPKSPSFVLGRSSTTTTPTISDRAPLPSQRHESKRHATAIRGGAANPTGADLLPTPSRRQRLVVLLVATALFNDMLQLTMLLPIIHTLVTSPPPLGVAPPTSLHNNNHSNNNNNNNARVLLGIFFASKDIAQMTFAPLAGALTARTSSRLSLLLSLLGLAAATLLFADAATFRRLLLARAAQGAASAAVLCGGMSLVAETHGGRSRGKAMGAAQTGLALGLLCGPLIGGMCFERWGRKRTFRLAAGILGLNAIGMVGLMGLDGWKGWREEREEEEEEAPSDENIMKVSKKGKSARSVWDNTKALLAERDILAVSLATLAIHAAVGVIKPLSQVVLDEEFGVTMVNRSFIISIATVAYFVMTPIAGYWCDAGDSANDDTGSVVLARRSNLVAGSLLLMFGSCAFFGLRFWIGIWAFYISVGLLGVALGLFKCSSSSLLADLVDRHKARKSNDNGAFFGSGGNGEYSMVYALADVSDSLGLIVGPIVGLYLSQLYGPSFGVIAIGSLSLMLVPILMKIP